jgi:hypothetical protein
VQTKTSSAITLIFLPNEERHKTTRTSLSHGPGGENGERARLRSRASSNRCGKEPDGEGEQHEAAECVDRWAVGAVQNSTRMPTVAPAERCSQWRRAPSNKIGCRPRTHRSAMTTTRIPPPKQPDLANRNRKANASVFPEGDFLLACHGSDDRADRTRCEAARGGSLLGVDYHGGSSDLPHEHIIGWHAHDLSAARVINGNVGK